MTQIIRNRLVLVAVAALAALVVIASPASATDDPAPSGPVPPAGAPAPPTAVPAPAPTTVTTPTGKVKIYLKYRRASAGRCGGIRIAVSGAGVARLKRVDIRAGTRRVGRDRTRPFHFVVKGSRVKNNKKVKIKLVGPTSTKTVSRRLRKCSSSRAVSAQLSAFEPIPVAIALNALLGSAVTSTV